VNASPELDTWLLRQREERFWSRTEMARRLIKAAESHGDTTMPRTPAPVPRSRPAGYARTAEHLP